MKDQGRKLSCKNDRLQQFLCLLVLLLDTYFLEKTLLHFMKKIAVRPSKVQHPERHTACADLVLQSRLRGQGHEQVQLT